MFFIIGGDGKEYGPVSAEQIKAWIQGGRASVETTLGRREDETQLRPLREFTEFYTDAADAAIASAPLVLASRWTRLGAVILDSIIGMLFVLPGILLVGFKNFSDGSRGTPTPEMTPTLIAGYCLLMVGVVALIVIQSWMISVRGQSMGKRIANIRIVKHDTNDLPGFVHGVLLRYFIIIIIGVIPLIGPLFRLVDACFIFGAKKRCLHDLIAGTKVVVGPPPAKAV